MENQNETTFENAKVGDRAWDLFKGPGVIKEIAPQSQFPIWVEFSNKPEGGWFNLKGVNIHGNRTLFWSEIQITPPPRPKRVKKVEIVRYVNAYKNHRNPDDYILEYSITKDEAEECAEKYAIAIAVPVTIPFEVEE